MECCCCAEQKHGPIFKYAVNFGLLIPSLSSSGQPCWATMPVYPYNVCCWSLNQAVTGQEEEMHPLSQSYLQPTVEDNQRWPCKLHREAQNWTLQPVHWLTYHLFSWINQIWYLNLKLLFDGSSLIINSDIILSLKAALCRSLKHSLSLRTYIEYTHLHWQEHQLVLPQPSERVEGPPPTPSFPFPADRPEKTAVHSICWKI